MNRWVLCAIACFLLAALGWIWIVGYLFGLLWIFRRKLRARVGWNGKAQG